MKLPVYLPYPHKGLTLIEMTIVLMILMALLGTGVMVFRGVEEWKLGRKASEALRTVHSAQRMYLSDFPTHLPSEITPEKLRNYLPGSPDDATLNIILKVESMEGTQLDIMVDEFPPVIDDGAGNTYDPSGKPDDSLWDVGE